jgi:hypothetical protein
MGESKKQKREMAMTYDDWRTTDPDDRELRDDQVACPDCTSFGWNQPAKRSRIGCPTCNEQGWIWEADMLRMEEG